MRRTIVYAVAAALLTVALVLTLVGWGDDAAKLPDWQAFVLGLVQGFTELLPISSSGHLIIVPWLGDWTYLKEHESFNKTFDVALHLGTLVAVVAYFWHDLIGYLVAWCRSVWHRSIRTEDEKIAWMIVVASIPAAIVGRGARELHRGPPRRAVADRDPDRSLRARSSTGPTAAGAERARRRQPRSRVPRRRRADARARAGRLALGDHDHGRPLPRASRDAAARLSFLLLVPIVLGAVLLKGYKDVLSGDLPNGWVGPFVVGTIASAGAGLLAIDWLLGYVRRHNYTVFVVYRLAVARHPRPADHLRRARRDVLMRVSVGDVELYVHEKGEGRPVLALHGGPGLDGSVWFPALDPLAEQGYRILAPDHRANGRRTAATRPGGRCRRWRTTWRP